AVRAALDVVVEEDGGRGFRGGVQLHADPLANRAQRRITRLEERHLLAVLCHLRVGIHGPLPGRDRRSGTARWLISRERGRRQCEQRGDDEERNGGRGGVTEAVQTCVLNIHGAAPSLGKGSTRAVELLRHLTR